MDDSQEQKQNLTKRDQRSSMRHASQASPVAVFNGVWRRRPHHALQLLPAVLQDFPRHATLG
jgi:hypothetical protein